MFTIKTLNAISPVGLAKLNKNLCILMMIYLAEHFEEITKETIIVPNFR